LYQAAGVPAKTYPPGIVTGCTTRGVTPGRLEYDR
jgi:hypothetical protein